MEFAAGDRVTVRGRSWIVEGTAEYDECRVLRLSTTQSVHCELLLPFDRPVKSTDRLRVRAVTRRRWMRLLHQAISQTRAADQLLGAACASIDLLPFQLEPAMALVEGQAARFLLADEVGLGKTIQASLMLAELERRGWCDRAIVLTPAGLRMQWQHELRRRFGIQSTIVDAASLARLHDSLPADINPWSPPGVFLSSIDFVKQPEVLRSIAGEPWDLLIVDEAHQVTDGSQRHEAVSLLANRSRHVVLLTATPHGGDEAAYRALCDLGRIDSGDRLAIFRRTRRDVAVSRQRRVHLLRVRPHPTELRMHRALEAYASRLWHIADVSGRRDFCLAAVVLSKRAFSSAASLVRSLERRVAALTGVEPRAIQTPLPLNADDDRQDEATMPAGRAFEDSSEEIRMLEDLLALAAQASMNESKLRVLAKLLARTHEPAIVFTEYRDTLQTLAATLGCRRKIALLHGGLSPAERARAVSTFTDGDVDVLLSTDAGAEGLNLHHRCRLVVNLELPWNPIRLEQRIGRVDRIGQERTVHAFNLLANDTAESDILASLLSRLDCIQSSEIDIAASIIDRTPLPHRRPCLIGNGAAEHFDLGRRARVEAGRLTTTRRLVARQSAGPDAKDGWIAVAATRRRRFPTICVVRIRITSAAGRLVEDTLLALALSSQPLEQLKDTFRPNTVRQRAEELVRVLGPAVQAKARAIGERRAAELSRIHGQSVQQASRREHHIAKSLSPTQSLRYQPGLFDNRATRTRRVTQQNCLMAADECTRRTTFLVSDATIQVTTDPQIVLVLLSC